MYLCIYAFNCVDSPLDDCLDSGVLIPSPGRRLHRLPLHRCEPDGDYHDLRWTGAADHLIFLHACALLPLWHMDGHFPTHHPGPNHAVQGPVLPSRGGPGVGPNHAVQGPVLPSRGGPGVGPNHAVQGPVLPSRGGPGVGPNHAVQGPVLPSRGGPGVGPNHAVQGPVLPSRGGPGVGPNHAVQGPVLPSRGGPGVGPQSCCSRASTSV